MSGGKTLVHCYLGISRSVSICVAYLMRYKELIGKQNKFGAGEAVRYIRERRQYVKPNGGFMKQLLEYERYLDGGRTADEHEDGVELSDEQRRVQEAALKSIEKNNRYIKATTVIKSKMTDSFAIQIILGLAFFQQTIAANM